MTPADLGELVAQYRAGLEAEIALLRALERLAEREREVTVAGDFDRLPAIADERDRIVANLVTIESEMKPIRQALVAHRDRLDAIQGFRRVSDLHVEAGRLVASIATSDHQSLAALKEAERARRAATQALEKGETTLAAYRKVIAPPIGNATLINRRG